MFVVEINSLKIAFSELRKQVKSHIKICFDNYVSDCEDKLKSNTKCFFAFTKSLRKTNSLPNSMKLDSEDSNDRLSICNLFAKYFDSVYNPVVEVSNEVIYDPFYQSTDNFVTEMSFSPDQIGDAIKCFNVNKVASPDSIPMMFTANDPIQQIFDGKEVPIQVEN